MNLSSVHHTARLKKVLYLGTNQRRPEIQVYIEKGEVLMKEQLMLYIFTSYY